MKGNDAAQHLEPLPPGNDDLGQIFLLCVGPAGQKERSQVLRENLPAPKRAGYRTREPAAKTRAVGFACLPEPDALLRLPALENDSRFQEPPPVAALLLVLSCNADDVGG